MSRARLVGLHRGPREVVLVRHGESMGNLADADARERGALRLDLKDRDADVALSDNGRRQADALGSWISRIDEPPTLLLSSPYARAHSTARGAIAGLDGTDLEVVLDERLRERDLGVFDGLTGAGIRKEYSDEAERRHRLGKFYYQPPSGESWADVVLRVRSLLGDLRTGYEDDRVWIFSHQAVIMSFRYVLEGMAEQELLETDRSSPIPNASFTRYVRTDGELRLDCFADTSALDGMEADVTDEPSVTDEAES